MRPLLIALTLVVFSLPGLVAASASTAQLLADDPCLLPGLAELLSLAPRKQMEAAAFIADEDGSLVFLVWPVFSWHRSQSYRGPLPGSALAIAHTHPAGSEKPSAQDLREAERLRLPIFVVTRWSLWVIDPERTPRVHQVAAQWPHGIGKRPSACPKMRMAR